MSDSDNDGARKKKHSKGGGGKKKPSRREEEEDEDEDEEEGDEDEGEEDDEEDEEDEEPARKQKKAAPAVSKASAAAPKKAKSDSAAPKKKLLDMKTTSVRACAGGRAGTCVRPCMHERPRTAPTVSTAGLWVCGLQAAGYSSNTHPMRPVTPFVSLLDPSSPLPSHSLTHRVQSGARVLDPNVPLKDQAVEAILVRWQYAGLPWGACVRGCLRLRV